jgi:hypothetical protein
VQRLYSVHAAFFEPYADGPPGVRRFANRRYSTAGRPRFNPFFVKRRRRCAKLKSSLYAIKTTAGIDRAANIAAARKWIPLDPLTRHLLLMDDAMRERRGGGR